MDVSPRWDVKNLEDGTLILRTVSKNRSGPQAKMDGPREDCQKHPC